LLRALILRCEAALAEAVPGDRRVRASLVVYGCGAGRRSKDFAVARAFLGPQLRDSYSGMGKSFGVENDSPNSEYFV
jgi:hypothetical protein